MIIYKATFPNGKIYIGKTKDLKKRIYNHIWNSKKRKDCQVILYKAIQKYGSENIKWEVIHECKTIEEMDKMEVELIYQYESYKKEIGYNMVCGDRLDFDRSTNISDEYKLEIILKKLKANGHNPDKYVVITDELWKKIEEDYVINKLSIKALVRKYGITKQRITRALIKNNIEIDKSRCKLTNSKIFSEEEIQKVIDLYNSGMLIKEIAKQKNLTIMIISRILHDSGVRISKRFINGKRW